MPNVGGQEFPYTPEGEEAARKKQAQMLMMAQMGGQQMGGPQMQMQPAMGQQPTPMGLHQPRAAPQDDMTAWDSVYDLMTKPNVAASVNPSMSKRLELLHARLRDQRLNARLMNERRAAGVPFANGPMSPLNPPRSPSSGMNGPQGQSIRIS